MYTISQSHPNPETQLNDWKQNSITFNTLKMDFLNFTIFQIFHAPSKLYSPVSEVLVKLNVTCWCKFAINSKRLQKQTAENMKNIKNMNRGFPCSHDSEILLKIVWNFVTVVVYLLRVCCQYLSFSNCKAWIWCQLCKNNPTNLHILDCGS